MGQFYVKVILMEGSVERDRCETTSTDSEAHARELYDKLCEKLDQWGWGWL